MIMRGKGITYDTGFINTGVNNCVDRTDTILTAPPARLRELLAEVPARINDFLGKAVALVRERFGGRSTPPFVCTFASYHLPHRGGAREDLDLASYGVVKVLEDRLGDTYPDLPWEPKAAFTALADHYGGHHTGRR